MERRCRKKRSTTERHRAPAGGFFKDEVQKAFPGVPVKITFTSNIIRAVWRERQAESAKWLNQGIPAEILYVKNIIATVGELMEEG
jgi:sirohydrochlorin cobaltochelatase